MSHIALNTVFVNNHDFTGLKFSYESSTYCIKRTATGFKFDLKAGNGEVIATSEVYTTEQGCLNGIESVRKNAVEAEVVVEE